MFNLCHDKLEKIASFSRNFFSNMIILSIIVIYVKGCIWVCVFQEERCFSLGKIISNRIFL